MKIAVFGAGTMGSGIAQVFAGKGHTVLLYASSTASAQRHKDKLAASLNKRVAKGKMAHVRLTTQVLNAVRTPEVFLLPVCPLPLSLATTYGISFDVSSSPYLDVSVQAVPSIYLFLSSV